MTLATDVHDPARAAYAAVADDDREVVTESVFDDPQGLSTMCHRFCVQIEAIHDGCK